MITQSPPLPRTFQPFDRLKDLMNYSELKRMAYSILAIQQKKRFRTLSVLSCFPGEGKTLFCAAMAMAYADACRSRVLVVDTTTSHNPRSLILKDCLDPSMSQIDFLSLSERQAESNDLKTSTLDARHARETPSVEAVLVRENTTSLSVTKESDHALISKVASEGSKHYGLALLDTVPLTVKNKKNIDPYLAASLSDASVLIVSQTLLNAPDLRACLKVLQNPALHLIGVVSNEEFFQ